MRTPRPEFDPSGANPEWELPVAHNRTFSEVRLSGPGAALFPELSSVADCSLFGVELRKTETSATADAVDAELSSLLAQVRRELATSRQAGAEGTAGPRWRRLLRQKAREVAIILPAVTRGTIVRGRE